MKKAVRSFTLGHYSSQNSEDPENAEFRGALMIDYNGQLIQASVSGLTADADVLTSANLISTAVGMPSSEVYLHILNHGGLLPEAFTDTNSYLSKFR